MAKVITTRSVAAAELARLLAPRDDLVQEHCTDESTNHKEFGLTHGPFHSYRRSVEFNSLDPPSHASTGRDTGSNTDLKTGRESDDNGRCDFEVTQRVDFELAIPIWGPLFVPLVKHEFRRSRGVDRRPWWSPPQRMDARATSVLAVLSLMSVFAGFMGTLLSQTNTFFKQEFGVTDGDVGLMLAAVRIGAVLALAIVMVADRRGRRNVLLGSTIAGCLTTATGAVAPNLVWLGASQTIARAFSTAMALIIGVIAVEETPSGSRAFSVSVLAATAAFGAGLAVMMLWVADLSEGAWRMLYLIPLIAIPLTIRFGRELPETLRFKAHAISGVGHASHRARIPRGRFMLLAASGLLFAVFVAPASGFLNEYLRTDRGFDAGSIVAFQLLTNTPGGAGLLLGGYLADRHGRRVVGAIGMGGGVVFTVAMYLISGPSIWLWSLLGALLGTAAVPALAVYGSELFPTGVRGRANGLINLFSVAGSAVGLALAGLLADRLGGLGPAMALLAVGPALVVLLIVFLYPETSGQKLEVINPVDLAFESEIGLPCEPHDHGARSPGHPTDTH